MPSWAWRWHYTYGWCMRHCFSARCSASRPGPAPPSRHRYSTGSGWRVTWLSCHPPASSCCWSTGCGRLRVHAGWRHQRSWVSGNRWAAKCSGHAWLAGFLSLPQHCPDAHGAWAMFAPRRMQAPPICCPSRAGCAPTAVRPLSPTGNYANANGRLAGAPQSSRLPKPPPSQPPLPRPRTSPLQAAGTGRSSRT